MKITKFIFSVYVLSCFTMTIFGQTEQGNILIGGDTKLDFSSANSKRKTDEDEGNHLKTINFELSPQIGFFVADRFALGIELPVSIFSEKDRSSKYSLTTIAFAPFIRYYFGSSNVKPYLHGEIGFGISKRKYESMFFYEIGGGLGIFLNEKVSLDVELGYAFASTKHEDVYTDTNIRNISSGIEVGIGFIIVL